MFSKVNELLEANEMPLVGTKEFNNMCSGFFGGNPTKTEP